MTCENNFFLGNDYYVRIIHSKQHKDFGKQKLNNIWQLKKTNTISL